MLQIRLSKAPASEGSAGVKLSPVETVTVACPDHLVLADLPVAKGIGAATAASLVKTLGRRSRRQLGERVHFCVRCDFPVAIYGRLSPCEHAFVWIVLEAIQCATSSDSTARGPQRPVFSPGSNSQQHDLEDKTRRQPPREQPSSRQTLQPKPPYFGQQHHPSDTMSGSVGGGQQGFHQQSFDMQHPPQEPSQFADRQQAVGPETPFPEYPTMHPAQPSNVPSLVTSNPMLNPPLPFGYPPYPNERGQPFYAAPYDMPRQDSAADIGIGGVPFEQAQGGMVVDPRDAKGILAPQPMPLPPPPPPPPHMSHLKQNYYSGELGHDGQGYGWQHDNRDSFGGQG
ncbi:E3 ubiquitin-protein ligase Hakai isoform X1 [Spatholobus suberectus]|nr:E3 ubiquitin-protein ligase Hakai isoform X1 [Spatholobus suberectus]